MKYWLLIIAVLGAVTIAVSLYLADKPVSPAASIYYFKRAGELLEVHFLTFEAPDKQAKHLAFAHRRLEEFLNFGRELSPAQAAWLYNRYERELASAEFMAEQLTLLDHTFIPAIEAVYRQTLADYQSLDGVAMAGAGDFRSVAVRYNGYAIRTLLRKHQYTARYTAEYKELIEAYLLWLEAGASGLAADQQQKLALARKVLGEGKELEWAYDILVSIR